MSWAAGRKTRVGDQAYSLLGIFGIYLPMIYGEGSRAFSGRKKKSSAAPQIFPSLRGPSAHPPPVTKQRAIQGKAASYKPSHRGTLLSSEQAIAPAF